MSAQWAGSLSWRTRALMLRVLANAPGGRVAYQWLQRRYGTHHQLDQVLLRVRTQCALAGLVRDFGRDIRGAELVEVGTGWVPIVPLGFWLCGAASIHTFDLNRFLLPDLLTSTIGRLREAESELMGLWEEYEEPQAVRERLEMAYGLANRPTELMARMNLEYHAPADAATTGLLDDSIDIHYSVSVFEHVAPGIIGSILDEASRILRPDGLSVHVIDPSDHFANFDSSISRVNFLRFDDEEWRRLAGNDLAYHNRLRCSEHERHFRASDLRVLAVDSEVDESSLAAIEQGLPLASKYRDTDPAELSRAGLKVVARPGANR